METSGTKVFYFFSEKKTRRFRFVLWTAVIFGFAVATQPVGASFFLVSIFIGLVLNSFYKPKKMVASVSFGVDFLEIKTLSGAVTRADFKDLKQVGVIPRGSNTLLLERKNGAKEQFVLDRMALSACDKKQFHDNQSQFKAFTDGINQQLSSSSETAPAAAPQKPGLSRLINNVLFISIGILVLIIGILINFAGSVSRHAVAQGNSFPMMLVGSMLCLIGILTIARHRWALIVLTLFSLYSSFMALTSTATVTGILVAKVLILSTTILCVACLVLDFYCRKSEPRKPL